MSAPEIKFDIDEKALLRFAKRVEDRWQGQGLARRMDLGTTEAARLLVRPIRSELDSSTRKLTGNLRKSIRAGSFRRVGRGTVRGAWVGPTAPHRHLVIKGTNPHSLVPKDGGPVSIPGVGVFARAFHPGSKSNPFVDRAAERSSRDAFRAITRALEAT